MYNLFVDRQRAHSQQLSHQKDVSMKKYVKRYCDKTRPELLNNYQKRINQFIRRVQHEPIAMTLESDKNYSQKRSKFNTGGSKKFTLQSKKDVEQYEDVQNSFKYKNTADWTSIYNQIQRKQRQNNMQLFVKKYGDPSMAFRSVGSQSKYNPCYEFRDRSQQKQINPPMRYTNKPTQQVLIKIKNKYKKNKGDSFPKKENQTSQLLNNSDARLQRGSVNVSVKGDEQILRQSTPFLHSETHEGSNQGNDNHGKQSHNQKGKKTTNKYYFKEMMDLQQNITDARTKKLLRNMLYKCGVYRKKNKRAGNDTEVDQFSEFESVHNLK